MTEASNSGYNPKDLSWSNLGQGAPECGEIPLSPARPYNVKLLEEDFEYSPVGGLPELRDAIAEMYNIRYRKGKKSQYSRENVAISGGGRVGLTRVVSTLGRTNVGYTLPDYTAYEELLDAFSAFSPIPILLSEENKYYLSPEEMRAEVLGRGLSTILLSNPSNPTGKVIQGDELASWIKYSSEVGCALIFDEFYSHYIYSSPKLSVSAAEYVEDVDADSVIIIDGLTKNWRLPGWRVSWTLGPKQLIDALTSAGSFLDGGCARPMQHAALELVSAKRADEEAKAIKLHFEEKRDFLQTALRELGVTLHQPDGGFYCWGDLSRLPEKFNSGMKFFREALNHKVIIVPGEFFDINPGSRRANRMSRFSNFCRFSFGPSMATLKQGIGNIQKMLA
jgi:N-succinyldiaminopimelate aminotransferase